MLTALLCVVAWRRLGRITSRDRDSYLGCQLIATGYLENAQSLLPVPSAAT